MSKRANKTLIGGFVVGAIAIVVAGVLLFGGNRLIAAKNNYVLYFTGSIKGLNVGAPVQFKGVTIGEVQNIRLLMDPVTLKFYNQVIIDITPGQITALGEADPNLSPEENLELAKLLIQRGLRGKLEMTSLLTGKLQVSFDFYPDSPVRKSGIKSEYFELPTVPSDLEAIAKKLENIPFADLVNEALSMVAGINQVVRSPEVQSMLTNLDLTLKDMRVMVQHLDSQIEPLSADLSLTIKDARRLVSHLDQQVDPLAGELQTALQSASTTLNQAQITLTSYEGLVKENSEIRRSLVGALHEISSAARSIQLLADYLEQHPESLLQGKPGGN